MPSRLSGPRLSAADSPAAAVSASVKQRPCAIRCLRSRSPHGRLEHNRNGHLKSVVLRATTSRASAEGQAARDEWPVQRDNLITSLTDIDSSSSVVRIEALLNAYSILLDCSEETLPKACGHVLRYATIHVRLCTDGPTCLQSSISKRSTTRAGRPF